MWSPETGSAVLSRVILLIPHIQAVSGAYSRDSSRFPQRRPFYYYLYRQPPSGQPRVDQAAQLRTDGVDCQTSAGKGPVVLKVVPVTGATFAGITMDQLMFSSLFPHTLKHYWYVVDMCDEESIISNIGGILLRRKYCSYSNS